LTSEQYSIQKENLKDRMIIWLVEKAKRKDKNI
jgi:hypothetical protein